MWICFWRSSTVYKRRTPICVCMHLYSIWTNQSTTDTDRLCHRSAWRKCRVLHGQLVPHLRWRCPSSATTRIS